MNSDGIDVPLDLHLMLGVSAVVRVEDPMREGHLGAVRTFLIAAHVPIARCY